MEKNINNNNPYRGLLQGTLISTNSNNNKNNSIAKTTTRLFSHNRAVAGAMMLFSAAAIVEEAYAKEPVPFEFRPNDVILFQLECSPAYHMVKGTFNFIERIAVKYVGARVAYFLSKRMKKLYKVTDERVFLYEAVEAWVDALNGQDFLGGTKTNLADLAVFGVLRQMRHLKSGRDMVEHTRIGDWYSRMEDAVGMSAKTGQACGQINILTA